MIRIYVGWDSREPIGFHVFCHSLIRHASVPIEMVPLVQTQLRASGLYTRERSSTEATEFSLTRFLVPHLCNYHGHAIFLDGADMLCRADIAELLPIIEDSVWNRGFSPNRFNPNILWKNRKKAVLVAKHNYTPKTATKMDGQQQTVYERKNWSSVICFDNAQCQMLTPAYVNSATGLELHRFKWLEDEQIGALPLEWNYIVGADNQATAPPKIVHFSDGGPYFKGYEDCEYAKEWFMECEAMLHPQINAGVPT